MATMSRLCVNVIDGSTLITNKGARIGLARVNAPPVNTPKGQIAKEILALLVLGQFITYDTVSVCANHRRVAAIAEVWRDNKNINDAMIVAGYQETPREMEPISCGTNTEE